jgi:hypothetical protein
MHIYEIVFVEHIYWLYVKSIYIDIEGKLIGVVIAKARNWSLDNLDDPPVVSGRNVGLVFGEDKSRWWSQKHSEHMLGDWWWRRTSASTALLAIHITVTFVL